MDKWTCRVYLLYIQNTHLSIQYTCIHIQYIYLFLMQQKCKRITSIVFGIFKSAYYVWFLLNTDCLLLIYHLDYIRWCILHFSLILVIKANSIYERTTSSIQLYHQCNKSIHMTNGVTLKSLSASLQYKRSVATNCYAT